MWTLFDAPELDYGLRSCIVPAELCSVCCPVFTEAGPGSFCPGRLLKDPTFEELGLGCCSLRRFSFFFRATWLNLACACLASGELTCVFGQSLCVLLGHSVCPLGSDCRTLRVGTRGGAFTLVD